jgi:hypothetical protein
MNVEGTSLALLDGRIATFESSGKDFLRRYPGLMKRHATIWADRKFTQLRTGPRGTVEHHKNLAPFGVTLTPKPGHS